MPYASHPKPRIAVLQAWYTPYRKPLFQALDRSGKIDLTVIYCSPVEDGRQWGAPAHLPFRNIFLHPTRLLTYRRRRLFGEKGAINYPQGLLRTLNRLRPDILVGYEFRLESQLAFFYAGLKKCDYVTWSDVTAAHDARMGQLRRFIRRILLSRSCALIGASSATLEHFQTNLGFPAERSRLSILSAHLDEFQQAAATGTLPINRQGLPCRLLYVGHLSRLKGVDLLITAFSRLRHGSQAAELTIIGSGPQREALILQAERSGAGNRIRFIDPMPHGAIAAEMRRHDVFVFPSRLDVFGLVVAEAVACRLPVICSCYAGAAADLVDGNGIVVDPTRIPDMVAALEQLTSNPELRRQLASRSVKVLEKHNLDSAVSGFMEALEIAAGGKLEPSAAGNKMVRESTG